MTLFDLDNTLLAGDSDHAFGDYLAAQGWVDAVEHTARNDAFYADYCRGELDIRAYSEFVLGSLKGRDTLTLSRLQQDYLNEVIRPMILPAGQKLLAEHRARGDRIVIVTATNRFITGPIAHAMGVDDLLATEGEIIDGRYTGRMVGIPCYREGKVLRVEAWLKSQGLDRHPSRFYSDSHNDLPLLEWVDEPVVVDADERLTQYAAERGWMQISLR
ncbi:MAG: HAD family hydrolase [Pseudomonadales bacterium]|nr:HAD family hydrolase [Pseudomonadales bacterium]